MSPLALLAATVAASGAFFGGVNAQTPLYLVQNHSGSNLYAFFFTFSPAVVWYDVADNKPTILAVVAA